MRLLVEVVTKDLHFRVLPFEQPALNLIRTYRYPLQQVQNIFDRRRRRREEDVPLRGERVTIGLICGDFAQFRSIQLTLNLHDVRRVDILTRLRNWSTVVLAMPLGSADGFFGRDHPK